MPSLRDLREVAQDPRRFGLAFIALHTRHAAGFDARALRGRVQSRRWEDQLQVDARVWLEDGRVGVASGVGPVGALVEAAARGAGRGEVCPIPPPTERLIGSAHGLGLLDRRHAALTEADRVDALLEAEREARAEDARVTTELFDWSDRLERSLFANSNGVTGEFEASRFAIQARLRVQDGGATVQLSDSASARNFASVAAVPLGPVLARRALRLLGQASTQRGEVRAMLPPRVVARVLDALAVGLAEDQPWTRGLALDPRVHLVDDGALFGGLRSGAFDRRGVGPTAVLLVREGRLAERYLSVDAARRLGARPTGHELSEADDGRCTPRNLVMRLGARSAAVVGGEQAGPVLWVEDLTGFEHLNRQTGELRAKLWGRVAGAGVADGVCVERGARLNLAALLGAGGLIEILSDADRVDHVDAPAVCVRGVELL